MSILKDLGTAFSSLDVSKLNSEIEITEAWSKKINNPSCSTKSVIEVPYYGEFCGRGKNCIDENIFVKCYPRFKSDSSMPIHIDMTCTNENELWLLESKYLGVPRKMMKYGMAYCATMTNGGQNCSISPGLVKRIGVNYYLTDSFDGVVWADICRLLEVHRYFEKNDQKLKLFQAYFIHQRHTNFASKVVDIYSQYWSAIGNRNYGDYAITKGRYSERHAWKIHTFKAVNYYATPNAFPVCLIPPCQPPITPTPFSTDSSKNYNLFLIEIVPF